MHLLADGIKVKIDNADHGSLSKFQWHILWRTKDLPYVYRNAKRAHGDGHVSRYRRIRLHRQIMGFPARTVDHHNGDTLDNRRRNLRKATQTQQSRNTRRRNGKQFKGVSYCPTVHGKYKSKVPWRARIRVNGKLISLGFHATAVLAARAYNKAARKHFGSFACLNQTRRIA